MTGKPFTCAAEVSEYIAGERIQCLECGSSFAFLPSHLRRAHGMDARTYRTNWSIPASVALAGSAYRERHRDKMVRMIENGEIVPSHALATAAAAANPTSKRKVDWQATEQSERMKQVIAIRKPPRKRSVGPQG